MSKPFSQACENNKEPIAEILQGYFNANDEILEIGSGSAQHALFFAQQLAPITWQTSDLPGNHPGILAWLAEDATGNLLPPLSLNVSKQQTWPDKQYDGVFTANTFHIMSWQAVCDFFDSVKNCLRDLAYIIVYGPFIFEDTVTATSNLQFDEFLRARDPLAGLREFSKVNQQAEHAGLHFIRRHLMPANNVMLVWRYEK